MLCSFEPPISEGNEAIELGEFVEVGGGERSPCDVEVSFEDCRNIVGSGDRGRASRGNRGCRG